MQQYLEAQEKRIFQLEQEIKRLTEEISTLKNKPPLRVDKIEYKFDQLKVESLNGTLNIGLNPSDLNNMDEFSINSQSFQAQPFLFPEREIIVNQMMEEIMSELPEMVQETETQMGLSLDPSYHEFIKNDVERQLAQRIIMYFDNSSIMERSPQQFEQLKENVYEKVKSDLQVALVNFITQSNDQTGGNHHNGI